MVTKFTFCKSEKSLLNYHTDTMSSSENTMASEITSENLNIVAENKVEEAVREPRPRDFKSSSRNREPKNKEYKNKEYKNREPRSSEYI
jgi:hypothetical protein